MKERNRFIRKNTDMTPENMEQIFEHYDSLIREISERLAALEAQVTDHEARIIVLE